MRNRYKYSAICNFLGSCMICSAAQPQKHQHPNVIYVFPDQFRNHAMEFWKDSAFKQYINFVGDPVYTPSLKQFAKESIVFTQAQSNCPVSSPHRGMLLTGMYPDGSGVSLNCNSTRPVSNLRNNVICISDVYQNAGYNCAYFGKLHVDFPLPNDPQNPGNYVEKESPVWDAYTPPERRHGFDYWYSYGTFDKHKTPHYWNTEGKRIEIKQWSPTHETDQVISYLENKKGERNAKKPFFMMVSYNPPHSPYNSLDDVEEKDYNLYKDRSVSELLVRCNADKNMAKNKSAAYYFASVTGIDREFGRILKTLKRLNLDENTIVVFSSDHGESMCSQGVVDPKNTPYAEAMNVPFLIRYPERLKPRVDTLLLSTPDVMPTLLGLSGLKTNIPSTIQGYDLSDYLVDNSDERNLPSATLYIQNVDGDKNQSGEVISYFPITRGIKTSEFTLAFYINKRTKQLEKTLFFNDKKDPYQLNNLNPQDYPATIKSLCLQLSVLLKRANDPWLKERYLKGLIPY